MRPIEIRPTPHSKDVSAAAPTKRATCQHCRALRVFFGKPRTRLSASIDWFCFACRQPLQGVA